MKPFSRREFLGHAGKAGLAVSLTGGALSAMAHAGVNEAAHTGPAPATIPYTQAALPYAYSALEPSIDAMTMEIHYTKHAATYAKMLAEATAAENVNTGSVKLEDLLAGISKYSPKMRNNAGGHYNHSLFWQLMSAPGKQGSPSPALMAAITKDFGSMDAMKTKFNDAAKTRFGSGWAWVVVQPDKKLIIASTPNQDNPLMDISEVKGVPLFGLDVWEHAYYLKYQNKRPDYISAWWNVLNWDFISTRFGQMA